MATDRNEHYSQAVEGDSGGVSLAPLYAVLRRWPLMVVGLTIGMLCGALIHVTSTRVYQSSASLLVLKKRPDVGSSGDSRMAQLDDYVATQLTLIKSERIRRAAAIELRSMKAGFSVTLPDDDAELAAQFAGVIATRDRDTSSPNTVGNGIVLLTLRGTNPGDTKIMLDALIQAYQKELAGVYDVATRNRLELYDRMRDSNMNTKKDAGQMLLQKTKELSAITNEDVQSIRSRVTAGKDRANVIAMQLIETKQQLELIEKTGPNRRDRIATLAQVTGQLRGGTIFGEANGPEQTLRLLESTREAQSERLGKDHPQMKELEAQIRYHQAENRRLNPADPTGVLDELGAVEKRLKQQKITAELQLEELNKLLTTNEGWLKEGGQLRGEIEQIKAQIAMSDTEISRINMEKQTTLVTQGSGGYDALPITPPGVGVSVAPVLLQSLLYGLLIGLALGGTAVGVAEVTDRSFRSPAEIRRRLGVSVIGHIPDIKKDAPADKNTPTGLEPSLVAALRPKSIEAEAYRGVRTQLYFSTQGRGHQVIQVTSPNPSDGKSTLAANLAVTIAQSGKRVVLIDCDFRKPQVHKIFQLKNVESGLADVVAGLAPMAKALRRSVVPGLDLMPCGTRPPNPAELLTSPRFQQVITDLKDAYDFVIVDTPPVLAVSDPANVAPRVDGVIVVFKLSKNSRPAAERTHEQLTALGANILGVVVNGGAGGSQGYNGYNYGSRYGYRYQDYEYSDKYGEEDEVAPAKA